MAAETMASAAAGGEVSGNASETLERVPAAKLNQAEEPAPSSPAEPPAAAAELAAAPGFDAVAETEAAAAPVDNASADNALADNAIIAAPASPAVPTPTVLRAAPSAKTSAASAVASPLPTTPPNTVDPSIQARLRKDGAITGAGAVSLDTPIAPVAPTQAPAPAAKPVPKAAAKPAAKAKKATTKAPSVTAAPAGVPVPAASINAPSGPGLFVDSSVLNLGNVGSEADPALLVGSFRTAFDRVRPQTGATVAPNAAAAPAIAAPAVAPAPAVPVAPALAPAPAAAVTADPGSAEVGTPTTVGPQTVERCVTALFGPTDRRIVAAASATLGNRPVWVIRVESSSGTVDLVLNPTGCAELLRQPVS
jgi:hypothetical protein